MAALAWVQQISNADFRQTSPQKESTAARKGAHDGESLVNLGKKKKTSDTNGMLCGSMGTAKNAYYKTAEPPFSEQLKKSSKKPV